MPSRGQGMATQCQLATQRKPGFRECPLRSLQRDRGIIIHDQGIIYGRKQLLGKCFMNRVNEVLIPPFWRIESWNENMCKALMHILYAHIRAPAQHIDLHTVSNVNVQEQM